MAEDELKQRMKIFSVRIMQLVDELPKTMTASILSKQLLRAGTAIGANYRSVCRAKSNADFAAKLAIVEEEADETIYWLELLTAGNMVKEDRIRSLIKEANEFVAITVASIKTIRQSIEKSKIKNSNSKIYVPIV
ncbi:MAG: four helix bundle protein [Omnitrophica bacterium RIFCSPLOWO2_12_FULL_44_17]|uniref:Four helix bundle protein n=1 Tax=Candidatus Danuiimicrobium aquiferis TaxID=1801832 RepID=A0A1G1KRB7_9BACT|nr:MAG: four helix bundle protein [Omnitrophica bacterium RIFCSPLOWO2_12_FULL_44_17]OGX01863.1 MAG: four helix bundle protein [Omnitrophica bacterium RIFCSPLOWO2_02_FULL_44_11]